MAHSRCTSSLLYLGKNKKVTDRLREGSFKWYIVHPHRWIVCCVHRPSKTKVTRAPGGDGAPPFPEQPPVLRMHLHALGLEQCDRVFGKGKRYQSDKGTELYEDMAAKKGRTRVR